MLLVAGVRHLHTEVSTGRFACPDCGGDRPHRLRRPRAWLQLCGLPVVPLGREAAFVECGTCGGRFPPSALAAPTAERLAELLARGLRTAAAFVLTARPLAPGDLRRAVDVLRSALGEGYTCEELLADLGAHRQGSDLGVVEELAGHLRPLGSEALVRRLAGLVLALARPDEAHRERVAVVATALGVTPLHLRAIVAAAAASPARE